MILKFKNLFVSLANTVINFRIGFGVWRKKQMVKAELNQNTVTSILEGLGFASFTLKYSIKLKYCLEVINCL